MPFIIKSEYLLLNQGLKAASAMERDVDAGYFSIKSLSIASDFA